MYKHDDISIAVMASKVCVKITSKGYWKNRNFKINAIIPFKNDVFEFPYDFFELINQIGNKEIYELDDSNFEIEPISDEKNDSLMIKSIEWDSELTSEEKNMLEKDNLLNFVNKSEEKLVFEKGSIYEIEVKFGHDIKVSLVF